MSIDENDKEQRRVFDLHDRERTYGEQGPEDLVTEVGHQISRFLEDTERSLDGFFKGVRRSADQALELADDRRTQSFLVVLLAGAAVGAFAAGALARKNRKTDAA